MMTRLALAFLLLPLLASLWIGRAGAAEGFGDADVSLALTLASQRHGVSRWMLREVSRCESQWNPYAVGAQGEQGLFQIAPDGLMPEFRRRGFTSAFDPYQAAMFTAEMFAEGHATKWSCFHTEVLGRVPPWWE